MGMLNIAEEQKHLRRNLSLSIHVTTQATETIGEASRPRKWGIGNRRPCLFLTTVLRFRFSLRTMRPFNGLLTNLREREKGELSTCLRWAETHRLPSFTMTCLTQILISEMALPMWGLTRHVERRARSLDRVHP